MLLEQAKQVKLFSFSMGENIVSNIRCVYISILKEVSKISQAEGYFINDVNYC